MPDSLTLHDVSKRYGQGAPVLSGLSHTFEPGTATGLVGPNGSGKTTLLRLLSVISYPTTGRVTLGERDIHAQPHAYLQRVGIVHDAPQLPGYLSAEELLTWVLRARNGWNATDGPARVAHLLDAVRLDERRAHLIRTYSSGMTRKTQIAAALVAHPDVLLMDEPFRGLDTATTDAVVERLHTFTQGGLLVCSSHLRDPLDTLCDRYVRLGEGA